MANFALISIVLPVYNQADHIQNVVGEYEKVLTSLSCRHEIILVCNACRDESAVHCEELCKKYDSVKSINILEGGWGRAVRTGIAQATGDLICYTNLARTSPQDLLLLLLYALSNPGSVIKANRKIRESYGRRLGSLLYNLECRLFFDLPFWDINGTPKVFSRQQSKLLELTRNDDLIDLEFSVRCRESNFSVLEVPIFSSRRYGGKSTTGFKSAFKMYFGAYIMWRSKTKEKNG